MAAFPRANITLPGKRCIIRYQFSSLLQPLLSRVPSISDPPKSPRVLTTVFSHSDITSSQVDARFMTFGDLFGIAIRHTSHLFAFFLGISITICVTICLCCSLYGMIISSISHCLDVRIAVPTLFPLLNFLPLHHSTFPFFFSTFLSFCFASFLVCLASSVSSWYFCIISHYSSTSLMISLPTNPSFFVEN